ncbi:MAG TPA: helix-turn-helix domain-containing protein, partial [Anaeromyxobacteraceae bacterium]|nr:helix-turn-helix domain-containing protein [Anaeromyxobacteraceae bacterium]
MSSEHREAILTAATDSFARFGFRKTSIEDVAKRAGVGKGTVYLHFESKEALFAAAVRRVWGQAVAEVEAAVERARTPEAKVRAFLEVRESQIVRIARELRVSEEAVLELLPLVEPLVADFRDREVALLEATLAAGNAAGAFDVPDPPLAAIGVAACVHGLERFIVAPDWSRKLRNGQTALFDVIV